MKLANQFTWDEERLKSNSPDSISMSLPGVQQAQNPGPSRGVGVGGSAFRPTAPPPVPPSAASTTTTNVEYEQDGETTEGHRYAQGAGAFRMTLRSLNSSILLF